MPSLRDKAAASTDLATVTDPDSIERAQPHRSIVGFVHGLRPLIEQALPKHLNADRMARLALTEIRKTPKLAACMPESFAGALLTASALGLEIGTVGEAYLVPYEYRSGARRGQVECTLQVGYQGYSKLFYQHPLAGDIDAQAVFEADEFDYQYGTDKYLRHRPSTADDRGKVIFYYAVAQLASGASHFVVLTPAEVRELRGRVGPSGDIPDPQRWMERKTAVRQCLKMLPKSPAMQAAMVADDAEGSTLWSARQTGTAPDQAVNVQQIETGSTDPTEHEPGPIRTDAPPAEGTPVEVTPDDTPPEPDQNDPWTQPPAEETPPPAEEDWSNVDLINGPQRSKLHATLKDLHITDRGRRLQWAADHCHLESLASFNDLTKDQASQLIEIALHELEETRRAES